VSNKIISRSELTTAITQALKTYRPSIVGGIDIKKKYNRFLAFEVPVVCNTSHGGLVDAVEITEYVKVLFTEPYCRYSKEHSRKYFEEDQNYDVSRCPRENKEPDPNCDVILVAGTIRNVRKKTR